jgi:hypothetical protein
MMFVMKIRLEDWYGIIVESWKILTIINDS